MGIKRDVVDGIELWRSRPLRNSAIILGCAVMGLTGMAADSKWGPNQSGEMPVPTSMDAATIAP